MIYCSNILCWRKKISKCEVLQFTKIRINNMSVYHIFCTQGYANSLQTYIGKSCSYNLDKLDIFPLMCVADKVWIIDPILINKNIRSVCNSHAQKLTRILKKIITTALKISSVSTFCYSICINTINQKNVIHTLQ
jgi:hypothetical protein